MVTVMLSHSLRCKYKHLTKYGEQRMKISSNYHNDAGKDVSAVGAAAVITVAKR